MNNICRNDIIPGFNWPRYLMVMLVMIPLIIATFSMILFSGMIPASFIAQYIILSYTSPNLISVFLSNYAHANMMHLTQNILSYIITIASIAVLALVILPRTNKKTPEMSCRFGTKTMVQSTIIFFLIAPFVISAESVFVGRFFGATGGLGFSGIVFAFEGYLIYTIELLIIRKVQVVMHRRSKLVAYTGMGLALTMPVIIVLGQISTLVMDTTGNINYPAHLTGLLFGFVTPIVLEKIDQRKRHHRKITSNIRTSSSNMEDK